jgi:hypothetical protein
MAMFELYVCRLFRKFTLIVMKKKSVNFVTKCDTIPSIQTWFVCFTGFERSRNLICAKRLQQMGG